jgi:hypothetical protein
VARLVEELAHLNFLFPDVAGGVGEGRELRQSFDPKAGRAAVAWLPSPQRNGVNRKTISFSKTDCYCSPGLLMVGFGAFNRRGSFLCFELLSGATKMMAAAQQRFRAFFV